MLGRSPLNEYAPVTGSLVPLSDTACPKASVPVSVTGIAVPSPFSPTCFVPSAFVSKNVEPPRLLPSTSPKS